MHHVFVETNWVVAYTAPAYLRMPAALALSEKAAAGEISLHLPAICLSEARGPVRTNSHPRKPADHVRKYLAWATAEEKLSTDDDATVRRVLDQYESQFAAELQDLDERLARLRQLQPWDKKGLRKEPLSALYNSAHVSVYDNFSMEDKTPGWPDRSLPHTPQS